ncbi:MAG: ABC-F family ATP-binding cassette domain-containing protein [Firmicutes bacterium]|nr:ABC-F family ATP-binding cassette domain-containing protein [Bacillota bacterium]
MIIQDLWKFYGDELIFQDVIATIGATDHIGLCGANGAGKTTLLKTLVGELSPDRGSVSCPGGYTIGSLWQTLPSTSQSLADYLREPFASQIELEGEMRSLAEEMAHLEGAELEQAMKRYASLQDRFEHGGGYDYLVQINSVTVGLGFSTSDLERSLHTFSGGEQMRVSLARLLLSRPSLLVLDEPTNHLDIEAIRWLEDFLASYRSAFIVVSHDRYFLDKVANQIWELQQHRLYQYKGNYSAYLPQRELRQSQIEESLQRQQQERARMEAFIQKFKAGTRSRQAKNMEKRLARLPDLERVLDDPNMVFRFEAKRQSGNQIVALENIRKAYGSHQVLRGITGEIKRGQRIALLGPNGSGKSTLLKILAGELGFTGELKWGTGVDLGYFSQHISFDPENTVLEELYDEHRLELGVLRSVLARFLFQGEDVFKQTSVLSGGERNRLALARLLLHRPNFLVLDEPTNHLDIYAREALETALGEFGGTIIFVSHDRYFIDKLATHVWTLEEGSCRSFVGGYAAYEEARKQVAAQKADVRNRVEQEKRSESKLSPNARRKRLEARRKLEDAIVLLEERQEDLERTLASPDLYQEDENLAVNLIREYEELKAELEEKYVQWERLVDEDEEGGM